MSKKLKKIHYSKFNALFTLFIVLLILLLLFILNYYVPEDKKTFPITLAMIIISISFISVVVFTFLVTYRGIPFMIIKNESRSKKIYYSKHTAWFTLFIVLLFLLSMFILNYYATEDKKTFPITLVILTTILISLVIFTFIVSYREIPLAIIIEKSKKTYYNKFVAWSTLFALLPILLYMFISNHYAPEDKKIPLIVLAVLTIIFISAIIFTFIVAYRGITLIVIERFKKIHYSKSVAWFTLFILLLVLLVVFISNYYIPEDKKIPLIVIVIIAAILISIVVFTFLISYGRIPFMIIK